MVEKRKEFRYIEIPSLLNGIYIALATCPDQRPSSFYLYVHNFKSLKHHTILNLRIFQIYQEALTVNVVPTHTKKINQV